MPTLYLRSVVFDYGLLPVNQATKVSDLWTFLFNLILKRASNRTLDLSSWLEFVRENQSIFSLNESGARMLFSSFLNVAKMPEGVTKRPSTCDVREFSLFIYAQFVIRRRQAEIPRSPASRNKVIEGDLWPSPSPLGVSVEHDARGVPSSPSSRLVLLEGKLTNERYVKALGFFKEHSLDLLRLVCGVQSASRSQSKLAFNVTENQLDAFGFLLEVENSTASISSASGLWKEANSQAELPAGIVLAWIQVSLSDHEPVALSLSTVGGLQGGGHPVPSETRRRISATLQGVHKSTVVKPSSELQDVLDLKIFNCHDSYIYILSDIPYLSLVGCTDCTFISGPVSRTLNVEHCERIVVTSICNQLRVSNCVEGTFHVGTPSSPLFWGDNRFIHIGPFNSSYPALTTHLSRSGLDPKNTQGWRGSIRLDWPRILSAFGSETSTVSILPPAQFIEKVVPFRTPDAKDAPESIGKAKNPCPLPPEYAQVVNNRIVMARSMRQVVSDASLSSSQQTQLRAAMLENFREWLISTGNIRPIVDLQRLEAQR